MQKIIIMAIITAICFAASAFAAIINIPADYPTIQQGINASTDGDTVLVQPGTYVENINFNGHNIVLGSLFLTTGDTTYIAETMIDGDSSGSVVTFESGEDSTAIITGLTLRNGGYWIDGGGILCLNSDPTIIRNKIFNNSALNGAGIFLSFSNAIIMENDIAENYGRVNGGGIFSNQSNATMVDNYISGNQAGYDGGAIFCSYSSPRIENNKFLNNSAGHFGGAIHCRNESLPTIINSMFSENTADKGAGIHCVNSGLILTNSTLSTNWTGGWGGGLAFEQINNRHIELRNSIIWANSSSEFPEILIEGSSPVYAFYCNIRGGWQFGNGNIDSDPLFLDAYNNIFNVCIQSPCIDAGDPDITDPDGSRSDIGVYFSEHPLCDMGNMWYVSITGNDTTGDGSQGNPFRTIQHTILESFYGDTVVVENGTYNENVTIIDKNIILASRYIHSEDTTDILGTMINGDSTGSVITLLGCNEETEILGFTIENGYNISSGGGIHCTNSSPTIRNNIIHENHAGGNGGGIYCAGNSNPRIFNNDIFNNTARSGAGIMSIASNSIIVNNSIHNNTSSSSGGGLELFCTYSYIAGNVIYNNISTISIPYVGGHGGGVYCSGSPVFIGNLLFGNIAENRGGGMELYGDAIFMNNIFFNNFGTRAGGAILCSYRSYPIIHNTIFWNNNAQEGSQIFVETGGGPLLSFSNIQGGWEGEGNIDIDPLFRDPDNGDFHLMSTACGDPFDSPCIDAGSPAFIDSLLDCSWGLGTILSDMGAYGGGDSVIVDIDEYIENLPDKFALLQNFPNPFNPSTKIGYSLPTQSHVRIEIYNILGQKIATLFEGNMQAGHHAIAWQADDFPSGVYFARVETAKNSQSIKMVLIK